MLNPVAVRLLVLSAFFVASAGSIGRLTKAEEMPTREPLVSFPAEVGSWHGTRSPDFSPAILAVLGVDEYLNRSYRTGNAVVGLYIGYYQSQRQGDTIHSPLNCLPGAGWEPVTRTYLPIQVAASPRQIVVNRYLIRKGLDAQVVIYWYQSHGRVVANEYESKAFMVWDAIRSNRTDAALVRVAAPMLGTSRAAEEAAERAAVGFVQAIFPQLGRHLPE